LTNKCLSSFQCFKSSNDLLNAFNINSNLSRSDVQRLLPALANVKFNDGCRESEGHRTTWRSIERKKSFFVLLFNFVIFRNINWFS
jgi:hypothetical protein